MRIGIDARSLSIKGGIKNYSKNLILHLLKIDKKNEYFIFFNNNSLQEIPNKLIQKISIPFSSPYFKLIQDNFILPLKCPNLDIIHYLKNFAPILKRYKTIVTIHDIIPFTFPSTLRKIEAIYWQKQILMAIKKADKIIVPSYFVKEEIIKKFKILERKIKVIYDGYDENFKKIIDKEILEKTKQKYNLPDQFILYVSNISKRKNFDNLILAFAKLKIPHKLVIIGRNLGYYLQVLKLVKELNLKKKIIFTNFVEMQDLPCIYNLCSVFVYPSFAEGFGLPILEAFATGVPVITSNVSSLPEIANNAAVLVDPNKPEEIEDAINEVLKNQSLRKNLIEKGFVRIKDFSWQKTAQETLKIYDEIVIEAKT